MFCIHVKKIYRADDIGPLPAMRLNIMETDHQNFRTQEEHIKREVTVSLFNAQAVCLMGHMGIIAL